VTPVLAIAHMTMLELRRSRLRWGLFALLGLAGLALLVTSGGSGSGGSGFGGPAFDGTPSPGPFTGRDRGAAPAEMGTGLFALLVGLVEGLLVLLTLLTSAASVDDDIEAGTMLVVAARPISRAGIVIGKFVGLVMTQLMVVGIWGVVVGSIESLRAGDIAPFTPALLAILQSMPLLMLAAGIGLTMSVVFPARLAGLLSTGLFVFAAIVTSVSTRFQALAAAVPSGRLSGLGRHAEIELGAELLLAACLSTAAWVLLAAMLLERRPDLT
jgi:ABC-type transport system involved in multi-copper enzyme maturation permease subunit